MKKPTPQSRNEILQRRANSAKAWERIYEPIKRATGALIQLSKSKEPPGPTEQLESIRLKFLSPMERPELGECSGCDPSRHPVYAGFYK